MAQNKLPGSKTAIQKGGNFSRMIHLIRLAVI